MAIIRPDRGGRGPAAGWLAAREPEKRKIVTYAQQLLRMNSVDQAAANYLGLLSSIVNAFEVPALPDGDPLPRWAFGALAVRREGRWGRDGGPLS